MPPKSVESHGYRSFSKKVERPRDGPVWDVESGGTVCVLVADCQWPQSRTYQKPETMRVTFVTFESSALRTPILTIGQVHATG